MWNWKSMIYNEVRTKFLPVVICVGISFVQIDDLAVVTDSFFKLSHFSEAVGSIIMCTDTVRR